MDDEGLWQRRSKSVPAKTLRQWFADHGKVSEISELFSITASGKVSWNRKVTKSKRDAVLKEYFYALNYDEKLALCDRPEQIEGPDSSAWAEN